MDQVLLHQIIERYEQANFVVNRRLNAMFREQMPEGLTVDQFAVLRYLCTRERCTSSELADIFCVGKSSITAIVTRLTDKKLIKRLPDDKDRRVIYLALTDEGVKMCEIMLERLQPMLANYLKHFDEQEALNFIETFEKLAKEMMQS
ncbi:MAG: MarR family winged helix-turn-helix transcriptional regulator [Bacillota bacterium]